MNSTLRQESDLTERSDEEIKILLADANEKIKRLKEAEKNDPELLALREMLKEKAALSYGDSIKKLGILLKALRRQAAVRGILFEGATKVLEESADMRDRSCEF